MGRDSRNLFGAGDRSWCVARSSYTGHRQPSHRIRTSWTCWKSHCTTARSTALYIPKSWAEAVFTAKQRYVGWSPCISPLIYPCTCSPRSFAGGWSCLVHSRSCKERWLMSSDLTRTISMYDLYLSDSDMFDMIVVGYYILCLQDYYKLAIQNLTLWRLFALLYQWQTRTVYKIKIIMIIDITIANTWKEPLGTRALWGI